MEHAHPDADPDRARRRLDLASDCEQMVAGARGRSAGTQIMIYAGAYHRLRPRGLSPVRAHRIGNSASPSGRVHIGTNAAARADALKRVPQWFAR